MTIPPLAFDIKGRDQSGPAFRSARRNIGDTRRAANLMNADIKMASASIAGIGKSALAAGVGIASFSAAILKLKQGLADFDRIAKVARQNGLDGEFYQTLAFMAGEASVDVGVLDNALRKFTIAVGEAKNGSGALYTELNRIDPALLDMILSTESAEQRLRLYANAVAQASNAEDRAALVKAAFGQRGADLVRVLELGAGAMDQSGQKARQLGNIIETRILDQAEEMQNRLGNAADALDKQLNAALIAGAPLLIDFYEGLALNVKELREFVDLMPDVFGQLEQFKGRFREATGLTHLDDFLEGTSLLEGRIGFASNQKPRFRTGSTFGGEPEGTVDLSGRLSGALSAIKGANDNRSPVYDATQWDALLTALDSEKQVLNDVAAAGQATNDVRRATSSVLGETSGAAVNLTENLTGATRQGQQLSSVLSSGLGIVTGMIDTGNTALDRFLATLVETTAQALLFGNTMKGAGGFGRGGGGGLGGVLSGLFGGFAGFFENGGRLGPGEWGIAGENGKPEPVFGPAQIVSNDTLKKVAGNSNAPSGPRAVSVVVDVSGARGSREITDAAKQGAYAGWQMAMTDMSQNFSSIGSRHNKGKAV